MWIILFELWELEILHMAILYSKPAKECQVKGIHTHSECPHSEWDM